jgi:hypothetical protein
MKTLLLMLLFVTPSHAQDGKAQRLERFYKTCLQNSLAEGKDQEKVCACLKANYDRRLDEKSLEVLAKAHEGKLAKEALEANESVLEFDLLAAEKCVENPLWKWELEKLEKGGKKDAKSTGKPKADQKMPKTKAEPATPAKNP